MANIGIFFGSTEGNTERVVNQIQKLFGDDAELHNVKSASSDDMQPYPHLILACPTWDVGRLQEDWESFIDEIENVDYTGKKVTYLGLGDADGYRDSSSFTIASKTKAPRSWERGQRKATSLTHQSSGERQVSWTWY